MHESKARPEDEKERLHKERQALERLHAALDGQGTENPEEILWDTLKLFAGCPFYTAKNLEFTYTIKGNEMFVSRKEKSITRATVNIAFRKAAELGAAATGPKKLGTFGASYLYPVFVRCKIIKQK